MRIFFCCPTWIRTKTNRTKICRTTIILSGNTSFYGTAKISVPEIYAKCFLNFFFIIFPGGSNSFSRAGSV